MWTQKMVEHRIAEAFKAGAYQGIGWAYADCCADLDKGNDPRKTNMADVIARADIDLDLILRGGP